ncbi:MAG: hypothetical protein B7X57_10260, partial [Erythrobacter sp. 34-65-8]
MLRRPWRRKLRPPLKHLPQQILPRMTPGGILPHPKGPRSGRFRFGPMKARGWMWMYRPMAGPSLSPC